MIYYAAVHYPAFLDVLRLPYISWYFTASFSPAPSIAYIFHLGFNVYLPGILGLHSLPSYYLLRSCALPSVFRCFEITSHFMVFYSKLFTCPFHSLHFSFGFQRLPSRHSWPIDSLGPSFHSLPSYDLLRSCALPSVFRFFSITSHFMVFYSKLFTCPFHSLHFSCGFQRLPSRHSCPIDSLGPSFHPLPSYDLLRGCALPSVFRCFEITSHFMVFYSKLFTCPFHSLHFSFGFQRLPSRHSCPIDSLGPSFHSLPSYDLLRSCALPSVFRCFEITSHFMVFYSKLFTCPFHSLHFSFGFQRLPSRHSWHIDLLGPSFHSLPSYDLLRSCALPSVFRCFEITSHFMVFYSKLFTCPFHSLHFSCGFQRLPSRHSCPIDSLGPSFHPLPSYDLLRSCALPSVFRFFSITLHFMEFYSNLFTCPFHSLHFSFGFQRLPSRHSWPIDSLGPSFHSLPSYDLLRSCALPSVFRCFEITSHFMVLYSKLFTCPFHSLHFSFGFQRLPSRHSWPIDSLGPSFHSLPSYDLLRSCALPSVFRCFEITSHFMVFYSKLFTCPFHSLHFSFGFQRLPSRHSWPIDSLDPSFHSLPSYDLLRSCALPSVFRCFEITSHFMVFYSKLFTCPFHSLHFSFGFQRLPSRHSWPIDLLGPSFHSLPSYDLLRSCALPSVFGCFEITSHFMVFYSKLFTSPFHSLHFSFGFQRLPSRHSWPIDSLGPSFHSLPSYDLLRSCALPSVFRCFEITSHFMVFYSKLFTCPFHSLHFSFGFQRLPSRHSWHIDLLGPSFHSLPSYDLLRSCALPSVFRCFEITSHFMVFYSKLFTCPFHSLHFSFGFQRLPSRHSWPIDLLGPSFHSLPSYALLRRSTQRS